MGEEQSAENERMKLCYIDYTTEKTDGINVERRCSTVRGPTLDDCLKYTRELHEK